MSVSFTLNSDRKKSALADVVKELAASLSRRVEVVEEGAAIVFSSPVIYSM